MKHTTLIATLIVSFTTLLAPDAAAQFSGDQEIRPEDENDPKIGDAIVSGNSLTMDYLTGIDTTWLWSNGVYEGLGGSRGKYIEITSIPALPPGPDGEGGYPAHYHYTIMQKSIFGDYAIETGSAF